MRIDIHTHLFPEAIRNNRNAWFAGEPAFKLLYDSPKSRMSGAEELIQVMDEQGIDRSVVFGFPWISLETARRNNDYIIKSVNRHSDRLIGFCCMDPGQPGAENEVLRCLIYSVRPFACRCMNSFSSCHKTGFAEQSEWMVALNTLYLQLIEHLDCNGWSGNLIDLIWHLTVQPLDPEKSSRLLVKNRPIRTLVIPPEYRGRISPVIQELWGIISPAVSGNYPP